MLDTYILTYTYILHTPLPDPRTVRTSTHAAAACCLPTRREASIPRGYEFFHLITQLAAGGLLPVAQRYS